jgi:RNA recognition motif-containing protein
LKVGCFGESFLKRKGMNKMNIYVGNLVFDVGESELREAFEQYGQVTEVRIIMDKYTGKTKGFGFIEMPEKEEAQKAIAEMNEKEFKGRAMKVNEAKPKTDRGGGGGRRGGGGGGYGGGRGGRGGGGGGYGGGNRDRY